MFLSCYNKIIILNLKFDLKNKGKFSYLSILAIYKWHWQGWLSRIVVIGPVLRVKRTSFQRDEVTLSLLYYR